MTKHKTETNPVISACKNLDNISRYNICLNFYSLLLVETFIQLGVRSTSELLLGKILRYV